MFLLSYFKKNNTFHSVVYACPNMDFCNVYTYTFILHSPFVLHSHTFLHSPFLLHSHFFFIFYAEINMTATMFHTYRSLYIMWILYLRRLSLRTFQKWFQQLLSPLLNLPWSRQWPVLNHRQVLLQGKSNLCLR